MRNQLRLTSRTLGLVGGLLLGALACGPQKPSAPAEASAPVVAKAPVASAPVAPQVAPSPAAAPAPKAVPPKAAPVTPGLAPTPTAAPQPAVPPRAPAPEASPAASPKALPPPPVSPMSDPGGEVAVKPTKAGLARVGASACKMCHKVQFASWSETAHAKRTPPLDCESCHGLGSEYKGMAVMKDAAKAKAAGLVLPGTAFCTTCHKRGWNDGMLKKAHAHKI